MADWIVEIANHNRLFPETSPGSNVYLLGVGGQVTALGPSTNPSVPPTAPTGIPVAARTAASNTGVVSTPGYKGVLFHFRITAAPGSPSGGLTFQLQVLDEADPALTTFTTYNYMGVSPPTVNGVGSFQYLFYPGVGQGVGGAIIPQNFSGLKQIWPLYVPPRWRAVIAHANGTDSYTYSLAYTPLA